MREQPVTDQLYKRGVLAIVAGVHDHRFTAEQIMRACAARIEALEPRVQAFAYLDLNRAFDQAHAVDDSGSDGVLAGVPIAIKDIIDVAGMPTGYGSEIYASARPVAESAACVSALERAGAIIVGKTVTTEFAYYTPGKTRNPWNLAHTPGGSSMGSAASVACGMVAAAVGTQTNGSVIRPAAFCGVVGFKPTLASISNHGTMDPWPTLDQTGVFARSVEDAAAVAAVIASHGAVSAKIMLPAQAPRLVLVHSPVWHLATRDEQGAIAASTLILREAGATLEERELPPAFEDALRVHRVIMAYEAAAYFHELQQRHRGDMSVRLNELLDEGAAIDEKDYRQALAAMHALRTAFDSIARDYDAIITPPAPGAAPATLEETGSPAFCTIWTLLGVPAITIPSGLDDAGLPLGLQIIGGRDEDDRVLSIAAWCESQLVFRRLYGLPLDDANSR